MLTTKKLLFSGGRKSLLIIHLSSLNFNNNFIVPIGLAIKGGRLRVIYDNMSPRNSTTWIIFSDNKWGYRHYSSINKNCHCKIEQTIKYVVIKQLNTLIVWVNVDTKYKLYVATNVIHC